MEDYYNEKAKERLAISTDFRRELCLKADEYPLGAHYKQRTPEEAAALGKKARKRKYCLCAHMGWAALCRLERIVYEYTTSFTEFVSEIASGELVIARREDVMRVFKEEHDFAKGLGDECWDSDPNGEETEQEA